MRGPDLLTPLDQGTVLVEDIRNLPDRVVRLVAGRSETAGSRGTWAWMRTQVVRFVAGRPGTAGLSDAELLKLLEAILERSRGVRRGGYRLRFWMDGAAVWQGGGQ